MKGWQGDGGGWLEWVRKATEALKAKEKDGRCGGRVGKDASASPGAAQCAGAGTRLCRMRGLTAQAPSGVGVVPIAGSSRSAGMSEAEADRWAWLLVLSFVFGCNVLRILLPSFSSFVSGCVVFQVPGGRRPSARRPWRGHRALRVAT